MTTHTHGCDEAAELVARLDGFALSLGGIKERMRAADDQASRAAVEDDVDKAEREMWLIASAVDRITAQRPESGEMAEGAAR